MKYLSLKYSESILAFQLQFGTYEAESEHFSSSSLGTSGNVAATQPLFKLAAIVFYFAAIV